MTISQTTTGVQTLTPASEETIYAPVGEGGCVVLLDLRDMASGDELTMRHSVAFPVDGTMVVSSKIITFGTTTDDTWADGSVAGDPDALGWTSWPLGFGEIGGFVTLEATAGSGFDVEYVVLDLGGPTG